MIVLIDTDILIDVALDRAPFASYSSAILDYSEKRFIQAFVAWHSIANFYYIFSSDRGDKLARAFLEDLLEFTKIAPTATDDAQFALSLNMRDFEDALQVAAARACSAKYIITRNVRHFKQSPIPPIRPDAFLSQFFQ